MKRMCLGSLLLIASIFAAGLISCIGSALIPTECDSALAKGVRQWGQWACILLDDLAENVCKESAGIREEAAELAHQSKEWIANHTAEAGRILADSGLGSPLSQSVEDSSATSADGCNMKTEETGSEKENH